MCRKANTPGYRVVVQAMQYDITADPLDKIRRIIRENTEEATKYNTYRTQLNPNLTQHPMYTTETYVPDYKRQALTRLRLMSHNLKIETGRWSRTPAEMRLCECGENAVQSEEHLLLRCPMSNGCRERYAILNFSSLSTLMDVPNNLEKLCEYVYDVMRVYVWIVAAVWCLMSYFYWIGVLCCIFLFVFPFISYNYWVFFNVVCFLYMVMAYFIILGKFVLSFST